MASFYELLQRVTDILKREGRTSYSAIKREFDIDDDLLRDLKTELIDVRQIAHDVDGKVLELTTTGATTVATGSSGKANGEDAPQTGTSGLETHGTPREEIASHPDNAPDEQKPVKKTLLIWVGAALVLVGVLLPWVTVHIQLAGFGTRTSSVNGLKLNQGLLSIGVGLFSALMGFLTARRSISAKVVALLIAVTGVVVIGITLDVMSGNSGNDLNMRGFGGSSIMNLHSTPQPGVFITLIGGVLLALGGFIALIRARKRI